MHRVLKISAAVPFLFAYVFVSCLVSLFPASGKTRLAMRIRNASFFSRLGLALFGVRVNVDRDSRLGTNNGSLIVSNHLSYLDVLIISSLVPAVFITSVELKHTPVLGTLAWLSGCLFVERRKPSGLKREIADIAEVLGQGFSVALFPEGTTSNGDCVRQFKNSLFDAAVRARADIRPFCLRYVKINDEKVTAGNRDAVLYYGGMTLFRHLPKLAAQKSIDVDVVPLNAITVQADASRKKLAAQTYNVISTAYQTGRKSKNVMFRIEEELKDEE